MKKRESARPTDEARSVPGFVGVKGGRGVKARRRRAGAAGRGVGEHVGVGLLVGSDPQGMCGWG